MRSGYRSFDFIAQLARGNRADLAPADLLDLLGARAFVDDSIIDHFDVRNINSLIDDGGVVHDRSGANGLKKTTFLDKHVTSLRNSARVYFYDT